METVRVIKLELIHNVYYVVINSVYCYIPIQALVSVEYSNKQYYGLVRHHKEYFVRSPNSKDRQVILLRNEGYLIRYGVFQFVDTKETFKARAVISNIQSVKDVYMVKALVISITNTTFWVNGYLSYDKNYFDG